MADKESDEETRRGEKRGASERSDEQIPSKTKRFTEISLPKEKEKTKRSRRSSGDKHKRSKSKSENEVNTMLRKSLELQHAGTSGGKGDGVGRFEDLEELSADNIVDKLFEDYIAHKSSRDSLNEEDPVAVMNRLLDAEITSIQSRSIVSNLYNDTDGESNVDDNDDYDDNNDDTTDSKPDENNAAKEFVEEPPKSPKPDGAEDDDLALPRRKTASDTEDEPVPVVVPKGEPVAKGIKVVFGKKPLEGVKKIGLSIGQESLARIMGNWKNGQILEDGEVASDSDTDFGQKFSKAADHDRDVEDDDDDGELSDISSGSVSDTIHDGKESFYGKDKSKKKRKHKHKDKDKEKHKDRHKHKKKKKHKSKDKEEGKDKEKVKEKEQVREEEKENGNGSELKEKEKENGTVENTEAAAMEQEEKTEEVKDGKDEEKEKDPKESKSKSKKKHRRRSRSGSKSSHRSKKSKSKRSSRSRSKSKERDEKDQRSDEKFDPWDARYYRMDGEGSPAGSRSQSQTDTRGHKERSRDRSRERSEDRSRDSSRSRHRSRDRDRHRRRSRSRDRHRDRDYDRKKDRRDKDREKDADGKDLRLQIDKAKLRKIAIARALANMEKGQGPAVDLTVLKSGGKSVQELTEFCKRISEKEKARGAVSSDSDSSDGRPSDEEVALHHPFKVRDPSTLPNIIMNIRNARQLPVLTPQEKQTQSVTLRTQFPVSSGSQHRAKESEWVPVTPTTTATTTTKAKATTAQAKPVTSTVATVAAAPLAIEAPPPVAAVAPTPSTDSVFPTPQGDIDIGNIVAERLQAMRRLEANPYDMQALSSVHKMNEQANAWAQSKHLPGQFTGTTDIRILSQQELAGPDKRNQAWAKKDQFRRAPPLQGGIGMFLLQKMGWRPGDGLGKANEGNREPLMLDVKMDRKGLSTSSESRAPIPLMNQHMGRPGMQGPQGPPPPPRAKDLSGKHPVSALTELCSKRRWGAPAFDLINETGPAHKKMFLFKVRVNGVEYIPSAACGNKKLAKAQAAAVCLQEMGLIPRDYVVTA